jgi:hypothetical protein
MPFGKTAEHTEEYWTRHFEGFLKPFIESITPVKVFRSEPLRGDILGQIVADLVSCPIVVADLTDANPNVYWELGVRQSFKHGTITIAESGTKLPFDVGAKGTLFYHPKNHLRMSEFNHQLRRAIEDCIGNPDRPDSHVLVTMSGRGSLFEIFRRDETLRRLQALLREIRWNEQVIEETRKFLKKNKNEATANRMRTASTDLLITNRYIDENDHFFLLAEKYLAHVVAINESLEGWAKGNDQDKKWLNKEVDRNNRNSWSDVRRTYQKYVEFAYDQIRKST